MKEQTYSSWLQSITAKLEYESTLQEEAFKIFQGGGKIVKKTMKKPDGTVCLDKSGEARFVEVLEYGRYKPKKPISAKNLRKLGIFVDEVKDRELKKNMRKGKANEQQQTSKTGN